MHRLTSLELQRGFMLPVTVLLLAFVYLPSAGAQTAQPQPTPLTAPPPLKLITKEDRQQLDQAKDAKQKLRLTIELSGVHLTRAEELTNEGNFDAASAEIGMYHALIENALQDLAELKRDSNKTRDLYKRLELSLRAHGPRLTAMRRITPLEFAVWIKNVEDFARAGRTEALNSFYGHTVVREPQKTKQQKPQEKPEEKPNESPTPKSNQP